MKYLKFIYAALFAYFLLSAAPAFAQFEVSPDHFDQPATANKNTTSAKKPQSRTNQAHQAASSTTKKQSVAGTGKPSPAASAANGTHPARRAKKSTVNSSAATPSLKAQASAVHRE
ncbi:MAG TPA: hypothetical protein VHW72_15265 [Candidatus Angelobacter sp.]|jgi:hypothetical protein|nr:hypothetical protein [Candidatus Angelobacter sp.]